MDSLLNDVTALAVFTVVVSISVAAAIAPLGQAKQPYLGGHRS